MSEYVYRAETCRTRRICPKCGAMIMGGDGPCPECGYEVPPKRCPHCKQLYAGYLGDPPVCPACGEELPPE